MTTSPRAQLLKPVGEEAFAQHVKRTARRYGWDGVHTRYSEGVIEGVHTRRLDGYSEAYGLPDWDFWSVRLGQCFWAELKRVGQKINKDQERTICDWRLSGRRVFVWRPTDEDDLQRVFRDGLGPLDGVVGSPL
jgi:hypothetical protein